LVGRAARQVAATLGAQAGPAACLAQAELPVGAGPHLGAVLAAGAQSQPAAGRAPVGPSEREELPRPRAAELKPVELQRPAALSELAAWWYLAREALEQAAECVQRSGNPAPPT
jgi:hypothetical protein